MRVYKTVDEYSRRTGEKCGTRKVVDFEICDFTGQRISDYREPCSYDINFKSSDPCFGDGEGERWWYSWNKEHSDKKDKIDPNDLFGQNDYIFGGEIEGKECVEEMLKKALKEIEDIWGLDQILRWSRAKMLERLLKRGEYTVEQFLQYDE